MASTENNKPSFPKNSSDGGKFSVLENSSSKAIWEYISKEKLLIGLCTSFVTLIGFSLKSTAFKRVSVKRKLVRSKDIRLRTGLPFISRPGIFREWDQFINHGVGPQQMVLIEGYQGTGKTFLIQKYIEEQSRIRPTLYINLGELTHGKLEKINWRAM